MEKRIAIVQSNYIPWKGYFDLIHSADEFIFLDCVQYTKRDWRNRNRIKTNQGSSWLSIPVEVTGKFSQSIRDTVIADKDWGRKHWASIKQNYAKAKHFVEYENIFEELYLNSHEKYLSDINFRFVSAICNILGISTRLSWSTDFKREEGKTDRLVSLCKEVGATQYISGPAAMAYLEEARFREHGIDVRFFDYEGYPEYPQLYPPFDHRVSVLDLVFNQGKSSTQYMKTFPSLKQPGGGH